MQRLNFVTLMLWIIGIPTSNAQALGAWMAENTMQV